ATSAPASRREGGFRMKESPTRLERGGDSPVRNEAAGWFRMKESPTRLERVGDSPVRKGLSDRQTATAMSNGRAASTAMMAAARTAVLEEPFSRREGSSRATKARNICVLPDGSSSFSGMAGNLTHLTPGQVHRPVDSGGCGCVWIAVDSPSD